MKQRGLLNAAVLLVLCGSLILATADCSLEIGPDGGSFSTGSDGGGSTNSSSNLNVAASHGNPEFNSQTTGITQTCGVSTNTTIETWTLVFDNGTTQNATTLYYPFNHGVGTGYLAVATKNLHLNNVGVAAINAEAINEWSNTLQNRVSTNGVYGAAPQEDPLSLADPYVSEDWSTSYDPNSPDTLASTSLGVRQDGSYLNATLITWIGPAVAGLSQDNIYSVAMHELGHAQGLAHNRDAGSIMFPFTETTQDGSFAQCFHWNGGGGAETAPPNQDTVALEGHYDPVIIAKTTCGGCPCPQVAIRSTKGLNQPNPCALVKIQQSNVAKPTVTVKPTQSQIAQFWNGLNWYQAEDTVGGKTIAADSLYAVSPLVVRGRVGRTAANIQNGTGDTYPIHTVRVESVFRNETGRAGIGIGSTIYVADNATPFGKDYADDPTVKPGEEVVLYLRHPEGRLFGTSEVYIPTVPFAAKWRVDSTGHYRLPSGSRVASTANGRSAFHAFQPPVSAGRATASILAARGYNFAATNALQQAVRTNPYAALMILSRRDAREQWRPGVASPLL